MHVHAKLVALTQPVAITATTPEEFVAYAARVSNPSNQNSHDTASKLLAYCVRNRHWSVFEMVNALLHKQSSARRWS